MDPWTWKWELLAWVIIKRKKYANKHPLKKKYIREYFKKNMLNLKTTPHAQLQPPSITINDY